MGPCSFDDLLKECLRAHERIIFEGPLTSPQKAYLLSKLSVESGKDLLVITGEGLEETKLRDDIDFFIKKGVVELPPLEEGATIQSSTSQDTIRLRQEAFQAICERKEPLVVVSSLQATLQLLPVKDRIVTRPMTLRVGMKESFDLLVERLLEGGYQKVPITVMPGEFSVRGGIIDFFSLVGRRPTRVEFFGEEIDSIRAFDATSQRALEELAQIDVGDVRDPLGRANASQLKETIFSFMGPENTIVVLDDIEKLEERYAGLVGYDTLMRTTEEESRRGNVMALSEWLKSIQAVSSWSMFASRHLEELVQDLRVKRTSIHEKEPVSFSFFGTSWDAVRLFSPLESLSAFYMTECLYNVPPIGEMLLDAYSQIAETSSHTLIVQSDIDKEWLAGKLKERGASLEETHVAYGYLSSGFARSDTRQVFLPMSELSGSMRMRKASREEGELTPWKNAREAMVTGFDAYDLEPGDNVVHFHHGVGKFLGVETKKNAQGVDQEFFLIEYAESSKLYVPLHQAHLITKYIGAGEGVPAFHTLGGSKWKKIREDTEKAIVGYAAELLKAHAKREMAGGLVYPSDGPTMMLFEEQFPYEETEDQKSAIEAIKSDMCSKKAMDRLICGDVGYGKTEVAMRAAFKAVADGKKQVAILVPTTVLALQHYENFSERMTPFGIRLGILSRFQTTKQKREVIEKVAVGQVDILVGTHKLLQKDLAFHDLGLVIIDEEQRFGVKAKEHLKVMKSGVDCLTLSATPIPRTLYMSLVGARDLSTIATPPYNRIPIKTIVAEYDEELVQKALLREINRGGQVFYIHNRVETIEEACCRLQKLIPRARIIPVHGQMKSDDIDLVFHSFKRGEVDVLVATSIIENGIDIPNANTILVERADRFGVSELYQLRGRVGRSNRRAFAYFLTPPRRLLPDIARKRIAAIAQSGGYGGGLKVAMRDLEMRGAGDILGVEQSGHVSSIGFHLYCKLLKRTIRSLQGEKVHSFSDTKVEVPYPAKLPEWYVNDVSLRVEFYQRLGEAASFEEIEALQQELKDRFGTLPVEAEWLLAVVKIRILAGSQGIHLVKMERYTITLERGRGESLTTFQFVMPNITTPARFFEKVAALHPMQK